MARIKLKVLERIMEKRIDKLFHKKPNMFAFLFTKGVSAEIAEAAQAMMTDHFLKVTQPVIDGSIELLKDAKESIERINEKLSTIESQLDEFLE